MMAAPAMGSRVAVGGAMAMVSSLLNRGCARVGRSMAVRDDSLGRQSKRSGQSCGQRGKKNKWGPKHQVGPRRIVAADKPDRALWPKKQSFLRLLNPAREGK
jgi:hypothetical protein